MTKREDANWRLVGSAVPIWHWRFPLRILWVLMHILERQRDWILMSVKDSNIMGDSKKVSRWIPHEREMSDRGKNSICPSYFLVSGLLLGDNAICQYFWKVWALANPPRKHLRHSQRCVLIDFRSNQVFNQD